VSDDPEKSVVNFLLTAAVRCLFIDGSDIYNLLGRRNVVQTWKYDIGCRRWLPSRSGRYDILFTLICSEYNWVSQQWRAPWPVLVLQHVWEVSSVYFLSPWS
jgi:hypothetical protein